MLTGRPGHDGGDDYRRLFRSAALLLSNRSSMGWDGWPNTGTCIDDDLLEERHATATATATATRHDTESENGTSRYVRGMLDGDGPFVHDGRDGTTPNLAGTIQPIRIEMKGVSFTPFKITMATHKKDEAIPIRHMLKEFLLCGEQLRGEIYVCLDESCLGVLSDLRVCGGVFEPKLTTCLYEI